ncbi:MAG: hypothetical protein RL701_536 [Pseudomonadota bacterium]
MRARSAKKNRLPKKRPKPRVAVNSGRLPVPSELLVAGTPLNADLEIERQQRMEALKALLVQSFAEGRGVAAIDQVLLTMSRMERDNERLAWRVLRETRYRFGRSTEKLSRDELQQLFLALGGDAVLATQATELVVPVPQEPTQPDELEADSAPESAPAAEEPESKPPKKRKRVRSMQVAPSVERNVILVAVPKDELCCGLCGEQMKVFDHVEHETFRFVPAKVVVDVERREKAGCGHCREDITVAPRQQVPAVARKVDASLLAKLLGEKCSLALPLDRQRRQLQRLGLDIPEKTLASYWAYAADLIEPVAAATLSLAFAQSIVGIDDTHLKTLDKGSKHGAFRGHMWCFVGTDDSVGGQEIIGYGYTPTWQAAEISVWCSAIEGMIQCDGYAGYASEVEDDDGETMIAVPDERRLGCGMHIRSKFHAALLAKDNRAAVPLQYFLELYAIESDCKARGFDAAERAAEREKRSVPILHAFDAWVDLLHPKLLPKSPMRRATTYAINQRAFFRRCFDEGRFEIDNGRVERRIRPFAVARRNFLFTGSVRGGERLANVFTLVDNCLALGVDPYVYLVDVINKLERAWPMRRLSELIPHNWVNQSR